MVRQFLFTETLNFIVNLIMFSMVTVMIYKTGKELRFHFNLGSKINFFAICTSTCMRFGLTIYEFSFDNY